MIERIIGFMQRVFSNLEVFCFGIIIAIIGIALFKIITKVKQKRFDKIEHVLVPFVIAFMVFIAFLLLKSWGGKNAIITDAHVLSASISFVSPFIAFTGAYTIFNLGKEKEEEERKRKEEKAYVSLYQTLRSSVENTLTEMNKIGDEYHNMINNPLFKDTTFFTGDVKQDLILIYENNFNIQVEGLTYKQKEYIVKLKKRMPQIFNNKNYKLCIDDPEWNESLRFTGGIDKSMITMWLNMLNLNSFDNVALFINCRDNMVTIVNDIARSNVGKKYRLHEIRVKLHYISEYCKEK